jgi:hypothetical protein
MLVFKEWNKLAAGKESLRLEIFAEEEEANYLP